VPNDDQERAQRPKNKGALPGDAGHDRPAEPRAPFFLAVFQSAWRGSRIFRVYPGRDELLFIDVGPIVVFIDVDMARRIDTTHWAIKAAGALKAGVVTCVGGSFVVVAVLLRLLIRAALDNPSQAVDLLTGIAAVAVLAVVMLIVAVTSSVRRIVKRVAQLDALTEKGLRAEVGLDKWSFRASADDLSDVSIDPVSTSAVLGAREGGPAARLSFTHYPTGKWKLNLVRSKDTKAAVRAFRQLLGPGELTVNIKTKVEDD
jgi:hypothetical protein